MSILPQSTPVSLFDGKCCTKCFHWHPFECFYIDKKIKEGRAAQCKYCSAKYREENRDRRKAQSRDWHESNKEQQAEYRRNKVGIDGVSCAEYHRRRYHADIEKSRENDRRCYLGNIENRRRSSLAWAKRNPEKACLQANKRRARVAEVGGTFFVAEWRAIKAKYNYCCLCCGRREPQIRLTMDHVIPISKGGPNTAANIQPLCGSCNSSKNNKHIDYRPSAQSSG